MARRQSQRQLSQSVATNIDEPTVARHLQYVKSDFVATAV